MERERLIAFAAKHPHIMYIVLMVMRFTSTRRFYAIPQDVDRGIEGVGRIN